MPRTFTPHELATLTAAQVEALPPPDRKAFFLASAKATDPFYPWHLEASSLDALSFAEANRRLQTAEEIKAGE